MNRLIASPELLANSPVFNGLDESALTAVVQTAQIRKVKAGEFFFYEGEAADYFYLITAGRVRLSQITPDGKQIILHMFGAGDSMAIVAVLSMEHNPVSAEALEDATALAWHKTTFTQLMEAYPRIAINSLQLLASRFHELQDRYRELATERVERRVARTLLRLAQQVGVKNEVGIKINMALTREDIAQMTGTTLYSVSRILSGWEQKGLVKTGRESVTITSPHGMVIIAEDLVEDSD